MGGLAHFKGRPTVHRHVFGIEDAFGIRLATLAASAAFLDDGPTVPRASHTVHSLHVLGGSMYIALWSAAWCKRVGVQGAVVIALPSFACTAQPQLSHLA